MLVVDDLSAGARDGVLVRAPPLGARPRAVARAAEGWVPWVAEQLQRGAMRSRLRGYLRRALPTGAPAEAADEADRMLALAKRRGRSANGPERGRSD